MDSFFNHSNLDSIDHRSLLLFILTMDFVLTYLAAVVAGIIILYLASLAGELYRDIQRAKYLHEEQQKRLRKKNQKHVYQKFKWR